MKISVIITSYNQRDYLRQTIESVLAQTLKPCEMIICDDCSTDGSREMIHQYAGAYPEIIKPIFQAKNMGVTRNRNTGLKAAKGDYITPLDGDDLFLPGKLEKEFKRINESNAPLVYSNVIYIDEEGNKTGIRYKPNRLREGWLLEEIATLKYPAPREVLIAKKCIDEIGYLDENFKINEDFEWMLRLAGRFRFAAVNEPMVMHRYHSHGLHRSDRLLLLETLASVTEKISGTLNSNPEKKDKRTRRKIDAFLDLSRARVAAYKGDTDEALGHLRHTIKKDPLRSSPYDLLMRLYFPQLFKRQARLPDSLMIGPMAIPFYLARGIF